MDFSKCDETRREHGVLMRCAGNRGHDGEHVWTPAELRVRYESIFGGDAAKALDEILAELNDDPRDRRYSKEQVKRAFWKMLGDMLDDFAEEMFSLVDNSFHKMWYSSVANFKAYAGAPELPPLVAEMACGHCGQPIGIANVNTAADSPVAADEFLHAECYVLVMQQLSREANEDFLREAR